MLFNTVCWDTLVIDAIIIKYYISTEYVKFKLISMEFQMSFSKMLLKITKQLPEFNYREKAPI